MHCMSSPLWCFASLIAYPTAFVGSRAHEQNWTENTDKYTYVCDVLHASCCCYRRCCYCLLITFDVENIPFLRTAQTQCSKAAHTQYSWAVMPTERQPCRTRCSGLAAKTYELKKNSRTYDEWLWKIQTGFFSFLFHTDRVMWMFSEIERGQKSQLLQRNRAFKLAKMEHGI